MKWEEVIKELCVVQWESLHQRIFSAHNNGILYFIKKIVPRVWCKSRVRRRAVSGPLKVLWHSDNISYVQRGGISV